MPQRILPIQFEIRNVNTDTFDIIMPSNSASTTTGTGSAQIDPYVMSVQPFKPLTLVGVHLTGEI